MKKFLFLLCFCIFAKAQDNELLNLDFSKLSISKDEFLEIIQQANQKQVFNTIEWKNLLHFTNNKSEIINKEFFYSNQRNLKSEFELNLYMYFLKKEIYLGKKEELNQKDSAIAFSNDNDNLHFICKFPLRAKYIEKSLKLTKNQDLNCSDLNNFLEYISPKSISIVFPAAYLNSPASMFGHTFLLINSNYNSRLLSYAINYAADVDEKDENGLMFAFKGLFGGYIGKYSLKPYYDMLKTYKDSENRDLYEYDLKLNEEEVNRLILHLWEIKDSSSVYLFFDKNCSYNILWLLENANPDIKLRNKFIYSVIPSNTIQKINDINLISDYHYRASKLNTILNQAKDLSFDEINLAKNIALGKIEPNYDYSILALANELSQYYASKNELSVDEYKKITHKISSNLSQSKIAKLPLKTPKESIIKANYPSKISFAYDTKKKALLSIRPALHDIYEDDLGFDKGIGIEFLSTTINYDKKSKLDELILLRLASLSDFNYINHKPSFLFKLAYDDVLDDKLANVELLGGISFVNEYFLLSFLSGFRAYKDGLSFNNQIITSLSYKANKLSLSYHKNFYKHGLLEDILSIKTHFKIYKNTAIFAEFQKYFYKNETFKIGINYYF
ncbi:DUF4105 domain-containing protein [Campylobacter sp. RM12654]|uniref:Lnb N-terminal periplasmic domain-containing protein n=1 Tax=Campylobacter sp. RM12654 TaxID=2735738 RepID=UPI0030142481|nr:DUF4105 domain-containing protein [Campylobacter sp. RM12654]